MKISIALSGERYDTRFLGIFNSVGLIRSEYIFRSIERYPDKTSVEEALIPYLLEVSHQSKTSQIWYRTLEVDTTEANVLHGVEKLLFEDDPLLGLRGIRRSMTFPEAYRAELSGIATARRNGVNIGVIVPFVTYVEELDWAIKEIKNADSKLPVATMLETPAALVELDKFIATGVTRVVVGCNDLSSMLLAQPRLSRKPITPVSSLIRAIAYSRDLTQKAGVELAVAGYLHPTLIDACRNLGVDECVVHYSDLPNVLGDQWRDLPDLKVLAATKAKTQSAIRDFAGGNRLNHL